MVRVHEWTVRGCTGASEHRLGGMVRTGDCPASNAARTVQRPDEGRQDQCIVVGMIEIIGRTLRLVFGAPAPARPPVDQVVVALEHRRQDIEFSAYAEDCRLFGHLVLDRDRLTDVLNEVGRLVLVDVMVESLASGEIVEVKELTVDRDELLAVEANGPRGDPNRRTRMRPYPVGVNLGPYLVRGYVHTTPGSDPLLAVRRKRAMVPLTEATIEYQAGGTRLQRRSSTIVFNRELADWIVPSVDEAIEFPDLPIVPGGLLAKDFTGQITLAES